MKYISIALIIVLLMGTGTAYSQQEQIPSWIKSVANFWANDQISDEEFIKAIEFLINAGVIQVGSNIINTEKDSAESSRSVQNDTESQNMIGSENSIGSEDAAQSAFTSETNLLGKSKQLMLDLINEEREKHGLRHVQIGTNTAAQTHAENMLETCTSSHWGTDGLKPYMRYSLAGGYQTNAENISGLGYCVGEGYISEDPSTGVMRAMKGLMASEGHRENILDPLHAFVNIGIANDGYNTRVVQHFEHDSIRFESLPQIKNDIVSFIAIIPMSSEFDEYDVTVYYDQPPRQLKPGQLSRTYCYDLATPVVTLRQALEYGWQYTEDGWASKSSECPNPYDISAALPAPTSVEEAYQHYEDAKLKRAKSTHVVPYVTAHKWETSYERFEIQADLVNILRKHGSGVYTFNIGGWSNEEYTSLGQYSVFYKVPIPDGYQHE